MNFQEFSQIFIIFGQTSPVPFIHLVLNFKIIFFARIQVMDESVLMDSIISEYDEDDENPKDPDWRQTPAHKLNRQSKVRTPRFTDTYSS